MDLLLAPTRRRLRALTACGLTVAGAAVPGVSTASAAEPVSFASEVGTCNADSGGGGHASWSMPPAGAAHTAVLMRSTADGKAGMTASWPVETADWAQVQFGAGDVAWDVAGSLAAGQRPTGSVRCPAGTTPYRVDLLDVPSVPADFSGRTTPPAGDPNVDGVSQLGFEAPRTAQYVADVRVSAGAVRIGGRTVASVAEVPLGELLPGLRRLDVTALDGPPAVWSITVRALPVAVVGPRWNAAAVRPGSDLIASYEVSGGATISADVATAEGEVIRQLARDLDVAKGRRSLRWDGLDPDGRQIADGIYRLRFLVTDATGPHPVRTAEVAVDGKRPTVRRISPRVLSRRRGFAVRISDRTSGVRRAALSINGRTVGRLVRGTDRITYRPAGGWRRRSIVRWRISAVDRAGNVRRSTGLFRVR